MKTHDNTWDEPVLLAKAKLYMELALEQERDSWYFPFWATLSLELLARTTLASISPVLLASTRPNEQDGRHLIYALNRIPKIEGYSPRSIDSSEVFARCEQLVAGFTSDHKKFCAGMLGLRNEELHSGGTPFKDLSAQTWLPRFYENCTVLLSSLGLALADFVDTKEADAAAKMIRAANDESAKKVKGEIAAARTSWAGLEESERVVAAEQAKVLARRSSGHVVDCPACGSKALVRGEEINALPTEASEDAIVTRMAMLPTSFECTACGLAISSHNRLHAAGLGSTFTRTEYHDPVEYYGLYQESGYSEPEPDYNE